jgi:stalled ribosome rescue protein Dom34
MKQNNQKQYAGVWLDNAKAIIIAHTPANEESGYTIKDKIKAKESHAGGSEHTMNNARHADTIQYFKSVSGLLSNYDEILVFGPGKSQEQFQNHLQEDAQFKNKQITVESAEHLTDPQMIARVRDFFKSRQS